MMDHWMVFVSGPEVLDDIRRRSDEEVSLSELIEDVRIFKFSSLCFESDAKSMGNSICSSHTSSVATRPRTVTMST